MPNPGPLFQPKEDRSSTGKRAIAKTDISMPKDYKHIQHVGFDPNTCEFTGLPPEWERMLADANISKQEISRNPEDVVAVGSIIFNPIRPVNKKNRLMDRDLFPSS